LIAEVEPIVTPAEVFAVTVIVYEPAVLGSVVDNVATPEALVDPDVIVGAVTPEGTDV
jgi:hypothetical protein